MTFLFCVAGFHKSVDAVAGISWLDAWAQPRMGRLALAAGAGLCGCLCAGSLVEYSGCSLLGIG
jgi:hypothetical protein